MLANDTDADLSDVRSVDGFDGVSAKGATISLNEDGTLHYDPNGSATLEAVNHGEQTTDTFGYTVIDGSGATSTAVVTVTVMGQNHGPTALPDTATVSEDTSVLIDVLANDTDEDFDALFVTEAVVSDGAGTVVIEDNQLRYDPDGAYEDLALGQTAEVTLSYVIDDKLIGGTASAMVTLTITGTNDGPVAVADTGAAAENGVATFDVLANDTDVDDGAVFTLGSAHVTNGLGTASVLDGLVSLRPGHGLRPSGGRRDGDGGDLLRHVRRARLVERRHPDPDRDRGQRRPGGDRRYGRDGPEQRDPDRRAGQRHGHR